MPEAVPPPDSHPTAAIIPFPLRPQATDRRLHDALARLDAALAAQRMAVADWRHALANLRITVGGLGDGLRRYDETLAAVGRDISAAGDQARILERWADGVIGNDQPFPVWAASPAPRRDAWPG